MTTNQVWQLVLVCEKGHNGNEEMCVLVSRVSKAMFEMSPIVHYILNQPFCSAVQIPPCTTNCSVQTMYSTTEPVFLQYTIIHCKVNELKKKTRHILVYMLVIGWICLNNA